MPVSSRVRSTVFFLFAACGASSSSASAWNVINFAYNDDTIYYFDAETVVKSGDVITVWTKYVRLRTAEKDTSWSTAQRAIYSCQKRTFQAIATSIYDKKGEFIKSYPQGGALPIEVVPDTLGEQILKAVCSPNFPRGTDRSVYFPVPKNDVLEHARSFREYAESMIDQSPK